MAKIDKVTSSFYQPTLALAGNVNEDRRALYVRTYTRIFMELCANRFKWQGLPSTVDVRYLEMTLMRDALCVMYLSDKFGYLALKATSIGPMNMYDNPTEYTVYGNTFVKDTVKAKDAVAIWSNYVRQPDWDIINLYASRLADLEITREITAVNMRQTRLVFANENTRKSMTDVSKQINSGQATIYVSQGFDPNLISAIDMQIHPETLPKIAIERQQIWNDAMTMLGINNANQDKKERVQAAEVEANDEQVDMFKNVSLNARRQAAAEMGEKFDLEVKVEYVSQLAEPPTFLDVDMALEQARLASEEGGEE